VLVGQSHWLLGKLLLQLAEMFTFLAVQAHHKSEAV
jgi:hypothetical protein